MTWLTQKSTWRAITRACLALPALYLCYFFIVDSSRSGYSRFLSMLSIIQSSVEPADLAIKVTPKDPEAHYTRGLALVNLQRLDEALVELHEAIRLRPHHYYEWLDLGVTLDRSGDTTGAENALRRSISLAPSFAQPHWQFGNFLYRAQKYPEAFEELRRGASADPDLTEGMLPLAWVASAEDVGTFLSWVRPQNNEVHLRSARFLANQGRGEDAVQQVREAGGASSEPQRAMLQQILIRLMADRDFLAAYEVWKLSHPQSSTNGTAVANGDFLDPILRDDPGFGWQLAPTPTMSIGIDAAGPTQGTRSLFVQFAGEGLGIPFVTQLILVQPGTYSLNFMAKTENIMSGAPPVMIVLGVDSNPAKLLGKSPALAGTTDWVPYRINFTIDESTRAVSLGLSREPCPQMPCPIFGKIWLSRVSLTKS